MTKVPAGRDSWNWGRPDDESKLGAITPKSGQESEISQQPESAGLAHHSGLIGLSGRADLRDVRRAAAGGDPGARLALDVFTDRLRQGIAAMAASMGGLDLLVFTGGIGEHDSEVRARVVDGLTFLGLTLDREANAAASGDAAISAETSRAPVWVVTAREDVEVAGGTRAALAADAVL